VRRSRHHAGSLRKPRVGAAGAGTQPEYRYARNSSTFESFNTGTFAASVFAELEKSGTLRPLR
jgi:hypothetical protein